MKVNQTAVRSIWVQRTVIVEIPAGIRKDQRRIEEVVRAAERDYGPFYWDPVEGTECLELMDTAVGNQTNEVPDVSADPVSPLEHAEMRGESA